MRVVLIFFLTHHISSWYIMTMSWHQNAFHINRSLWGEPPGGFSWQTADKAEFWCFFVISFDKILNKHLWGQLIEIWHDCDDSKKQVIKSPQYSGGDFMFLYRFVRRRRRRRRPQILVHAITFEQLFGFLSFLAQLLALTCRLPDYILVDFRRDLDLDFSRSNMEFAISQPKMVRLPRNEKQTYRLNSRAQMWPSGLTLAMTLTLNFQGQI